MSRLLIVVEHLRDWPFEMPDVNVMQVDDYLSRPEHLQGFRGQIINLCRNYRYQSVGYYCALLAEARGHRVLPSVGTMLDLSSRSIYGIQVEDWDARIEKALGKAVSGEDAKRFTLDIFFGQCASRPLADLARELFERFPCPMLQAQFARADGWRLVSLKPLSVQRLDDAQKAGLEAGFAGYRRRRRSSRKPAPPSRYDLAILYNPDDPLPPSDRKALDLFVKAGRQLGVSVDLITRKDYGRLAEYDALFIRDTTRINHYTFRFAKRAEAEGMVVIDDPVSIMRCTNKVYLAELLAAHGIPAPKTVILSKRDESRIQSRVEAELGYPVVLKVPDGSFSQGVFKAESREELRQITERMFRDSELILAQEYLYTEFDWRIGVLDRMPIFACQYFMSRAHWQIVRHGPDGRFSEGGYKSWSLDAVPREVIDVALEAAGLIGDGLYGVDVKQNEDGVYVIEVNDNPNLEAGVEDGQLKGELYSLVMRDFVRRLDRLRFGL